MARWLALATLLVVADSAAQVDLAKRGEVLARKLCVGCHMFPDPGILDKRSWETGALPLMATRLGVKASIAETEDGKRILEDWDAIKSFYLERAPAVALPQAARAISTNLTRFVAERPAASLGKFNAAMARIHDKKIFVGNADAMRIDVLNDRGEPIQNIELKNPPVAIDFRDGGAWVTMIGTMAPSETPVGRVSFFEISTNTWTKKFDISDRLHRPVHLSFGDINGDGKEDISISTFGYISGRFAWFENRGLGKYEERALIERPGALGSRLADVDGDGKLDIIVAMAQGNEGVFVLLNRGAGKFQEFGFFQQQSSWGLASFDMIDFDKDGDLDILTANGDNGDYDACLKAYHGVRIFLNNGDFEFEEKYFFPMHGAFKAIAQDFDDDGDLDIAACAFFADYEKTPEEGFVYLENVGGLKFSAYSTAAGASGRWINMDAGDVDGDGDIDLTLAAMNKTPFRAPAELVAKWEQNGAPILILKNQTRR